jgi:type IV pilus assembly protein PilV
MKMKQLSMDSSSQKGMILLEGLIALVVFSFGVLALVGLQAAMLKNTGTSKYRSDASYIAQKRVGEMWADSANLASYVETSTDVSNLLPGGLRTVSLVSGTQYRVTVGWTSPGESTDATTTGTCGMAVAHCYITLANVVGA